MYRVGDYSMRPIEEGDLRQIFEWRNRDDIHSMMLTDHKITWEEHCRWFERINQEPMKRHFVFEYQGRPVGYIGYNDFDEEEKTCSPGSYLGDRKVAPADAGLYLFYMSTKYAFEELGMSRITGSVFEKNKKSLSLSSGSQIIESYYVQKNGKQELVHKLETTREQWHKNQELLRTFLEGF